MGSEFSETLDINLENQGFGGQDQVLVSTKYLKTSLGLGLTHDWWSRWTRSSVVGIGIENQDLVGQHQALVLVLT